MRILQQKRLYENQRGMMMQQSFNMEQTNFATESIKDTVTVVQAMKTASKEMKTTMRKLDISKIEEVTWSYDSEFIKFINHHLHIFTGFTR